MVRYICHSHRTADTLSESHFPLNCAIHIMPEIYFLRSACISFITTKDCKDTNRIYSNCLL